MSTRRRLPASARRAGVRALGAALLLALAAAGGTAGAQGARATDSSDTPAWLRARLDGRLQPTTRTAVERLIDSARLAGLPAEPLVDKALEGASKGGSHDAILRALRKLSGELAQARRALGERSLVAELSAGANAIQRGVDEASLRRLRQERPGQPLVVTLGVVTDLVTRGVAPDVATSSVLRLSRAGLADEQLVAFRRDVERDIGIGAPPATAVLARVSLSVQGPGTGATGVPGAGRPRP